MPPSKIPEHIVHASLGYKRRLQQILSQKQTLQSVGSIAESDKDVKLNKSPSKPNKVKKGMLPDSSGKAPMQGVNQKKTRVMHENQVKQIAKSKLMLKDDTKISKNLFRSGKTRQESNPFHSGDTKVENQPFGQDKTRKFKTPQSSSPKPASAKPNNPLKPHRMENNTTLFSMFDKPDEYKNIRSGKSFVKPAIIPENEESAKPRAKKLSGSGTKVDTSSFPKTKIGTANMASVSGMTPKPYGSANPRKFHLVALRCGSTSGGNNGGSGGGGRESLPDPDNGGRYSVPMRPNKRLEAYSSSPAYTQICFDHRL